MRESIFCSWDLSCLVRAFCLERVKFMGLFVRVIFYIF